MSLEADFRQVLAEMSLLQYGRTQAFNATGGKDTDRDPRPSGEAWTLEDKWRDIWTHHPTHATLEAARDELRAWKVRQTPAETDGSSEDDWVIEDGEGLTPDEAAMRFKRTPAMIRRVRLKHKRESEFGKPYDAPSEWVPDAHARIVNLAAQGCTERQIVMQVGVSKSTVRRALGRAA